MIRRPSPTVRRRSRLLPLAATLLALLPACSPQYTATPVPSRTPVASQQPSAPTSSSAPACDNALASYSPLTPMPKAGDMPSGSTMKKIEDRGRLIAGVSADTYLMGSRNPATGKIEGFDIDLVKAMAKAIFGDENKYELRVITAADRIPLLKQGKVDMVARNMTITCARWNEIAFSAEYYRSGQKVLVRDGSGIDTVAQLDGKRVCAPNGTSSMDLLRSKLPKAIAVGAVNHTGCLILFQRGDVDAITGDDTVLAGLADQDPYAVVMKMDPLSAEPYGLGFNADQVDLVRFANAVLAERVSDGDWKASYDRWLASALGSSATPPKPDYGRKS